MKTELASRGLQNRVMIPNLKQGNQRGEEASVRFQLLPMVVVSTTNWEKLCSYKMGSSHLPHAFFCVFFGGGGNPVAKVGGRVFL